MEVLNIGCYDLEQVVDHLDLLTVTTSIAWMMWAMKIIRKNRRKDRLNNETLHLHV